MVFLCGAAYVAPQAGQSNHGIDLYLDKLTKGAIAVYAGTSTLVGHLIGQAVYQAVAGGIRLEQGA